MAFELKRKETVPEGARRITCEQINKTLKLLNRSRGKTASDEAVHEARKYFKQLRGILHLLQREMGRKEFDRENRIFRDAARPLSVVRDVKVMIDALDGLTLHFKRQLARGTFNRLRAALQKRRREVRKQTLGKARAVRSIVSQVSKSARRIPDWPLRRKGWKAIAGGLRRTYQKGRDSMANAIGESSDQSFHEWRKRTKDLRYAIELLNCEWPESMQAIAESAHHLTDLLGNDHDLAVLGETVESKLKKLTADAERELLESLIEQRRVTIQKEAIELGRKLYAENEEDFVARMRQYWKAWRHPTSDDNASGAD